jgi:hypothetical protein
VFKPKLSQAAGEEAAGGVVGGHGHTPYRLAVRGRGGWTGCRGEVLRAGDRHGWRKVEQRREQLPDAKARVGGEIEFDLFAPKIGNRGLVVPSGRRLGPAGIRRTSKITVEAADPGPTIAYRADFQLFLIEIPLA